MGTTIASIGRMVQEASPRQFLCPISSQRMDGSARRWLRHPAGVAQLFSPNSTGNSAAADARTQTFAIRKDGRYVTTSVRHLADCLAGIYCVATAPDERGRGLGAFATAEPLRIARRLGYRVRVVQSSAAGNQVYNRVGFTAFGGVPLIARMQPNGPKHPK